MSDFDLDLSAAPPTDLARSGSTPPAAYARELPSLTWKRGAAVDPGWAPAIVALVAMRDRAPAQLALAGAVAAALDEDARDRLALELLSRWESQKFHGRSAWVADALAVLGGDRTAVALEPWLERWPRQSETGRKRAIAMLPVLRLIGTDTALLALLGLGQKQVLPSVFEAAQRVLEDAADDRGMSVWELGDAITPSCGLDRDGRRVFDLGAQQVELWLDDHLEPRVRALGGRGPRNAEDLPPAGPGDDPEKVRAAREAWSLVSRQLAGVTKVQSARLEEAMVVGRRWTAGAWRQAMHAHPLMIHYVRRLVWVVWHESGARSVTFRGAEDRSLMSVEGDIVVVPERSQVAVAHPLVLTDEERAAWSTHLADHRVIAPFAQIDRGVHRVSEEERDGLECTRFAARAVAPERMHEVFIHRHWVRDPSNPRRYFVKEIEGALEARVSFSPGLLAGHAAESGPQRIDAIEWRKHEVERLPLRDVPPVAFSEVLLDVESLF
jgi:hypothetical protein